MKTYIYQYLSNVSTNYHSGGGLVIITNRDPQDVWNEYVDATNSSLEEWENNFEQSILPEADMAYECSGTNETVFVFEDAGCC